MEKESSVTKSLPLIAMIILQFALNVSATLTKSAMISGLSQYVFIVYYDALGTILVLPCFIHHCLSGKRLPLTSSLICRFFGLSLIGKCVFPICLYTGLGYTSVSVVAAIGNLSPIFTFVLAICMRMERLDLKKITDQMKAVGSFIAVLGALVVTLYKGPALMEAQDSSNSNGKLFTQQSNWPLGCLVLILGCMLRSTWNIAQADTAKLYPDEISLVFFCNLFGTFQTAAASFFLVEGQSAWKINHKIEIIAIVYAAISLSVVTNTVLTWCLRKKGPLFVCMFDPLSVAISSFLGFMFLADGIFLGNVVGSTTIIVGFYAVMWGQAKTTNVAMVDNIGGLESDPTQVTPLLQTSHG